MTHADRDRSELHPSDAWGLHGAPHEKWGPGAPAGPPLHEPTDRADVDARRQELWHENEGLKATVARVEALHIRVPGEDWCNEDGFTWPCPTHRALRGPEPTEETS